MAVTGKELYTTAYDYDLNNRLKTETKDKGLQIETAEYQYDKNGNQISKTTYLTDGIDSNGGIDLYVVGSQRPLPKRAYTIEHYTYDAFNRLTKVQNDEGTSVYRYKVDGLRLSKDVNGDLTTHVWDGSNIVLEFGAVNDVYLRGINLIKSNQQGYYLFNAHGDVVQRTNSSGALIKSYLYDAFGVEAEIDESDSNPFRYCSEYFDRETGNIFLRARFYDPSVGGFISEDPAQDGLNWYTYCMGNPVAFVDPTGLSGSALDYITTDSTGMDATYKTHMWSMEELDAYRPETVYVDWSKVNLPSVIIGGVQMYVGYAAVAGGIFQGERC